MKYHVENLAWYHNVIHGPTFLAQCERLWSGGTVEDPQWLAVYCAVLSSAAWTIANATDGVPWLPDAAHTATNMMERAKACLYDEDFMSRHTVHSIQAICILNMVAHVLGRSDLLATLVSAAIRVAQCLGLHRIPHGVSPGLPSEQWTEALDREVGRRVWWKLVELDYHSMPYTGTLGESSPRRLVLVSH